MAKEKTEKCKCVPGMGILALILAVVGLYSIILGIKIQFISPAVYTNWATMLYYLVGIILMAFAKMSKHIAYCNCKLHEMH
jgi:hypothetical protein